MKIGFFTQPFHPRNKPISQSLREDHEAAIIADRNGFSEALFGEHITDAFEPITSSLAFISSLAYCTKNIKLGSCTVNLPNSHPVSLASTIAMLDHMLEGRLLMGISLGALPSDWEVFGSLDKNKEAMFEEAMSQVLELWKKHAPYNLNGEFWKISSEKTMNREMGLGDIMKPFQRPHPEILCSALMPNSPGLYKAAQKGWSPVSSNFLQDHYVSSHWKKYCEGAKLVNKVVDPKIWRVAKMIFVNEDNRKAIEYGKGNKGPYANCINQILKKLKLVNKLDVFKEYAQQPDHEITLEYCLDKLVIAGDPSSVKDQIYQFLDKTGPFGTLLYVGVDWLDSNLAKSSMELIANKVIHDIKI
jgi:alkanesulfonate monooxygenase SsuD/methylene tetrahydromethanopterin reductase-like flavin-dependent oxidoreductase (luciferase family)